jgi:anti-anti-sigma factor
MPRFGKAHIPPPKPFSISVKPDRERVVVAPSGEIDVSTVSLVRGRLDELADTGFAQLILDLRQVSFLDSSGIKLILDEIAREDVEFAVIAGPDAVQRVFEVTGTLDRVPFVSAPAWSAD